jgi:beta-galactosidase
MTYLSAVVGDTNHCHRGGWPGTGLRELFGIWAEEIDHLTEKDAQTIKARVGNSLGLKGAFKAHTFCDLIHEEGAEVVAIYAKQFYKDMPAITVKKHGKGKAVYIGAKTDEDFLDAFYGALTPKLGIQPAVSGKIPEGVLVRTRTDGETTWTFVLVSLKVPSTKGLKSNLLNSFSSGPLSFDPVAKCSCSFFLRFLT